jgi:hypothetical protein
MPRRRLLSALPALLLLVALVLRVPGTAQPRLGEALRPHLGKLWDGLVGHHPHLAVCGAGGQRLTPRGVLAEVGRVLSLRGANRRRPPRDLAVVPAHACPPTVRPTTTRSG